MINFDIFDLHNVMRNGGGLVCGLGSTVDYALACHLYGPGQCM